MKVKNLNGTSDNPKCPCGTWIKHWKNYTNISNPACFEDSCKESGTEGAHVQKFDSDMSWYIIPLCKHHNGLHGATIEIPDAYKQFLVPVTARDKCIREV